MPSRKLRRWIAIGCLTGILGFVLVSWILAGQLLASANRRVGPAPRDFSVEVASIPSDSGSTIATWYAPSDDSTATIVLVHGIRGNRNELLERAKLFRRAGYSVVMIDLQAHGESPGTQITLGHLERHDVRAAVEFARVKNLDHRIGVVGISLGGAATLLASPLDVDAIVLESVYPTIDEAVYDRISARVGPLSHILAPALLCQLQPRLGISPSELRPIDKIACIECPVLVAGGDCDQHTTLVETRRLFETAKDPKQLTVFEGAAHIDLLEHDRKKYEDEVITFLNAHLRHGDNREEKSKAELE